MPEFATSQVVLSYDRYLSAIYRNSDYLILPLEVWMLSGCNRPSDHAVTFNLVEVTRSEGRGFEIYFLLAEISGCSRKNLKEFAFTMPDSQRYKHFAVPKSNGGLRIISEPIEPLKEIQRLLLEYL